MNIYYITKKPPQKRHVHTEFAAVQVLFQKERPDSGGKRTARQWAPLREAFGKA
jgi:hypothetical protein